ncbi:hypothetical protein NX059_001691 [Plenodomus lindquistii]|nr:hypothetical protein NX059_001691 [Plenodomus lindquistii]
MADPLSLAGSVVGITAVGVQASIKLYALAEKVTLASDRVKSIADDITSTCAILGQIRDLIIPNPNTDDSTQALFNSAALDDIRKALSRCEHVFKEVESYHKRAFKQAKFSTNPGATTSLSWRQKAKWPFLQPQFDDIRNDLRDAKMILMMMIGVATFALTARNHQKRAVDEDERLEMESTIAQLQRTQIGGAGKRSTADPSLMQEGGSGDTVNSSDSSVSQQETSEQNLSGREGSSVGMLTPATPSSCGEGETFQSMSVNPSAIPTLNTFIQTSINTEGIPSGRSQSNARISTHEQPTPFNRKYISVPRPRNLDMEMYPDGTKAPYSQLAGGDAFSVPRKPIPRGIYAAATISLLDKQANNSKHDDQHPDTTAVGPIPSTRGPVMSRAVPGTSVPDEDPQASSNVKWGVLRAWQSSHLEGLSSGHGDSLKVDKWSMAQSLLSSMALRFINKQPKPYDPVAHLRSLNDYQRQMVTQQLSHLEKYTLLYINPHHTTSVTSVFGDLVVDHLNYVTSSKFYLETNEDDD